MDQPKIGFIGYGKHAQANLYPSIKALGYTIQAIATTHEESVKKAQEKEQIRNGYWNHLEMFEKENLDCVFISAKPEQQVQLVKDALHAGVHVFVEKNLGSSAAEAQEIEHLSIESGKQVMVGFMKRFSPIHQKAKELIQDARFGNLVSLSQTFTSRNFVQNSREYLLYAAIHYIDLLRFYLGSITQVHSLDSAMQGTLSQSIVCKAENGSTASLYYCASPAWDKHVEEIYITGTSGNLKTENVHTLTYSFADQHTTLPRWQTLDEKEIVLTAMDTTGSGGQKDLFLRGFVGEVDHFLSSIRNNTPLVFDAHENVLTMEVYDKIIAQLP